MDILTIDHLTKVYGLSLIHIFIHNERKPMSS